MMNEKEIDQEISKRDDPQHKSKSNQEIPNKDSKYSIQIKLTKIMHKPLLSNQKPSQTTSTLSKINPTPNIIFHNNNNTTKI